MNAKGLKLVNHLSQHPVQQFPVQTWRPTKKARFYFQQMPHYNNSLRCLMLQAIPPNRGEASFGFIRMDNPIFHEQNGQGDDYPLFRPRGKGRDTATFIGSASGENFTVRPDSGKGRRHSEENYSRCQIN
ncbi:hypothetical protein AVEN_168076-1 [Araneus ventricosus]|uniref:Uncharacterized protein n=1 Tax=Araneus ventricosus TaxID=182803 RepID=A0A4Y2U193_ARAVE|nr:hypothetical protein AVEN_168076-1 [Araneus ventricosus]